MGFERPPIPYVKATDLFFSWWPIIEEQRRRFFEESDEKFRLMSDGELAAHLRAKRNQSQKRNGSRSGRGKER